MVRKHSLRQRLTHQAAVFGTLALLTACSCGVQAKSAYAVAYISNQDGGVSVLRLDTLEKVRELKLGGTGPRGLGVTADGRYLLTANKGTGDVSVVDTGRGKLLRRIRIGANPEFMRVFRGKAYVTYEPAVGEGAPKPGQGKLSGPPAAIAVIDLKTWRVEQVLPSGQEAEGTEFSKDGRTMLVANEGDNTIAVYALPSGKHLQSISTLPHGERPRGIKASPDGSYYVVTLEGSDKLLVLYRNLQAERTVDTAKTPYGLAFDEKGERLFVVAAKAKQLQVFNARHLTEVATVPLGERCWHFTLTPVGNRLLVACGRSHDVHVIDSTTYRVEKVLSGFQLPWGIVTYPTANGSLDVKR